MPRPRPATATPASDAAGGSPPDERRPPGPQSAPKPDRRASRVLQWAAQSLALLLVCAAAALAALVWLTPSAGMAPALVRAEASKHRIPYPPPLPPARFAKALIATEDHRFYSPLDPGIDPFAVARVIFGQLTGQPDQGGSTIEQQLAKMLYTPGRHGLRIKLKQVVLALKLRIRYSKPQILSMYAEVAYFGSGYYGLENAACGYFGKPLADLTWGQSAMLAGLLNAPSLYDPRTHPKKARARQEHVFARLVAVGDLTRSQARAAVSQPLGLRRTRQPGPPHCTE